MDVPHFDTIKISTQTIIGISNLNVNTEKLFHKFTICPYKVIEKRRGRKKKTDIEEEPVILQDGSIITVKFGDLIRGVDIHQKKKQGKYFRNALTIVMFVDNKLVNFKITKNGRFQFTGCKSIIHAQKCIQHMWEQINSDNYHVKVKLDETNLLYTFIDESESLKIQFLTVMTNIDYNIGFSINREKLDVFINSQTHYNSLLETSFGYTGVNIKMKVEDEFDFDLPCLSYDKLSDTWNNYTIPYSEFLKLNSDNKKYKSKNRYNTFLVFHSGNIIMSGFNPLYMKDCYTMFRTMLLQNRHLIEEL